MKADQNEEALDFYDLLVDEKTDELSEYLSISVSNDGNNTKVSVATVEDVPTVYSNTFDGFSAPDLKTILVETPPEQIDGSYFQ